MSEEKKRGRKPNSVKTVKMSEINDLLNYIDNIPEKEDPKIPASQALIKLKNGFIQLLDKGFSYNEIAKFIGSSIGVKISAKEIKEITGSYQRKEKSYPVELLEIKYSSLKYLDDTPAGHENNDATMPVIDVDPVINSENHALENNEVSKKSTSSNIDFKDSDDSKSHSSLAERNRNRDRSGAGYINIKPDTEDI